MLKILPRQRLAPAVILAVVLLAAVNWMLSPEQPLRWLRAMLTLPVAWLALSFWHAMSLRSRCRRRIDNDPLVTRYFSAALSMAIVALGIWQIARLSLMIWVRFGDHGADLELERRVLGIATGLVLVVIGNRLPKILTPFSILAPPLAARVTTARRFIGTAWVMLGLTTISAFLMTRYEVAENIQHWAFAIAGIAMLGAIVWMNLSAMRADR